MGAGGTWALLVGSLLLGGAYCALQYKASRPVKQGERTYHRVKNDDFHYTYMCNIKMLVIAVLCLGVSFHYTQDELPAECEDKINSTDRYLEQSGYDAYLSDFYDYSAVYDQLYMSMNRTDFTHPMTNEVLPRIAYPELCDVELMQQQLLNCTSLRCTRTSKHYHKMGVHIKSVIVKTCVPHTCSEYDELKELNLRASQQFTPNYTESEYTQASIPRKDGATIFMMLLKLLREGLNYYNVAYACVLFYGFPTKLNKLSALQSLKNSMGEFNKVYWLIIYVSIYVLVVDLGEIRSVLFEFWYESVLLKLNTSCSMFSSYNTAEKQNYLAAVNQFEQINQQLSDMKDAVALRSQMLEHYTFCNSLAPSYLAVYSNMTLDYRYVQNVPTDTGMPLLNFIGFIVYIMYWPMLATFCTSVLFIIDNTFLLKFFFVEKGISVTKQSASKKLIIMGLRAKAVNKMCVTGFMLLLGLVSSAVLLDFVPLLVTVLTLCVLFPQKGYQLLKLVSKRVWRGVRRMWRRCHQKKEAAVDFGEATRAAIKNTRKEIELKTMKVSKDNAPETCTTNGVPNI